MWDYYIWYTILNTLIRVVESCTMALIQHIIWPFFSWNVSLRSITWCHGFLNSICSLQFLLYLLPRNLHFGHWFFGFLQSLARCPSFEQLKHFRFISSLGSIYRDFSIILFRTFASKQFKCFNLLSGCSHSYDIWLTVEALLFCLKTFSMICLKIFCSKRYMLKASFIL